MLPRFLNGVSVANHARSGETMKSFVTSFRWDRLLQDRTSTSTSGLPSGRCGADPKFGHNDEKKQWLRTYAASDGAYPAYLAAFVADVRQRGAQPVLVTPVARRTFGKDGKIVNSHAGYDAAVSDVAARLHVPVIDLTQETQTFYETLGPDVASAAFANGGKEKTHHNAYGAYEIACFVAHDLSGFGELKLKTSRGYGRPACHRIPTIRNIGRSRRPTGRSCAWCRRKRLNLSRLNRGRNMQTHAFTMQLKPGFEAEYQKRRTTRFGRSCQPTSPPRAAGVSDYSIFLDEKSLVLFGVLKRADDHGMADLPNHPMMKKWWAYMADIMDSHPDNSPVAVDLKPVFYMA